MKKPSLAFLGTGLAAFLFVSCGDDDDGATIDGGGGDDPDGSVVDGGIPDATPIVPDAAAGACTPKNITLARVALADGFDFGTVTDIKSPPGDERIFVLSKDGEVWIIDPDGEVLEELFLEIDVNNVSERGILGIAFHPQYAQNRRFFVFYTPQATGNITIAEGHASEANPNKAEDELLVLINEPHDAGNHNGGWLDFGPDGYLYATLGDNAKGSETAQDTDSPFGKIFRIDVATSGAYTSPATNPFSAGGGRPEVWAYGLRNPWRASFDRLTGDLYIADVGQGSWEEINVQPADTTQAINYGWATMEGTHCNNCNQEGLTLPVHEYDHNGEQASITGGYVYRGTNIPECAGTYFYADYVTNVVGSFRWNGAGGVNDPVTSWDSLEGSNISSWGLDRDGELLVAVDGVIHRIVRGQRP